MLKELKTNHEIKNIYAYKFNFIKFKNLKIKKLHLIRKLYNFILN